MTGALFDPGTALRERKAAILRRFTLADARVMCGLTEDTHDRFDVCPSCQAPGLNFIIPGSGLARARLTDDLTRAKRARCSVCNFSGDAVAFVQAAGRLGHQGHALDRIEAWLSETKRGRCER